MSLARLSQDEVSALRTNHYNASVILTGGMSKKSDEKSVLSSLFYVRASALQCNTSTSHFHLLNYHSCFDVGGIAVTQHLCH